MIEAVGWQYFDAFFAPLREPARARRADAAAGDRHRRPRLRGREGARSFANTHVFPGGCLPSSRVIADCVARATDMRPVWMEDISAHYARTLRGLARALLGRLASDCAERGYDERFRRLWTFYLASSEAGFRERRIGDVQMLLAKPRWRPGAEAATAAGRPSSSGRRVSGESRCDRAQPESGQGEPLVLLHGLGGIDGDLGAGARAARRRAGRDRGRPAGLRPLAAARRRTSRRPPPTSPRRWPTSAAALGVERPHVAGNSLGAWVGAGDGPRRPGRLGGRRSRPPGCGASRSAPAATTAMASAGGCARWSRALLRTEARAAARCCGHDRRPARAGPGRRCPRAGRAATDAPGYDAANREMRGGAFDGAGEVTVPVTLAWGARGPDRRPAVAKPPSPGGPLRRRCPAGATPRPGTTPRGSRELILEANRRWRIIAGGRLAQLGERLPYKQEVAGSSPAPPIRYTGVARGRARHRSR